MFVVTGVSGHTGSVVASQLLDAGKPVRVLVRSEEKGRAFRERGAEIAIGSIEDVDALAAALQGAEGAYLLIPPPGPEVQGIVARGRRIADVFVEALTRSPVPHVVLLSSVGAQHEAGTGPVVTLNYAEGRLGSLPGRRTFVRAAYFMENLGASLGAIQGAGILPALSDPAQPFPMVATQDIGEVAAQALLSPPAETEIIELAGPREYSFADAAAAFAQALGRAVNVFPVPPEGIVSALTQAGLGEEMAGLYREMSLAIGTGHMAFVGEGARHVRGRVPLEAIVGRLSGAAPSSQA